MVRARIALALGLLAVGGCGGGDPEGPGRAPAADAWATVVWAVGDAATEGTPGRRLARLITSSRFDRLLYLGDVYEDGTREEFDRWYEPLYGAVADRTAPVIGNHEFAARREGYLPYWREKLGRAPRPWYAVRAGGWELLALNTEAPHGERSRQLRWLSRRLRAGGGTTCRMALMHRPRFSAGEQGDQEDVSPLWDALRGRAVAVLSGHDHNLQRFEPVDGIVQFVSGAGGRDLYDVDDDDERLAFSDDEQLGALRLELRERTADYAFVAEGGRVLDRGELRCEP
jgi:hypothetical protein